MIGQVDYIQPYIQMNDGLPYVGGELERLTSATPFWRGQGIPIYNSMQQQGAFYGQVDEEQKEPTIGDKALSWFDTFKKGQESTYKPPKDLDLPQSQYTPSGMDGKTMLAITAVSLVVLGGIYLATRD